MLLYVRQDAMLPDALDGGIVEVPAHEVARTDGGVAVVQFRIGVLHDIRHPIHGAQAVRPQPSTKQTLDRLFVRREVHEGEPPAQREVHQCDGAVGRVHRPDHVQVVRHRERGLFRFLIHQLRGSFSILQQEVEFAEHLGEVPAVDLVDDQEVLPVRIVLRLLGDPHERSVLELESRLPVSEQRRAVTPHEILVRIGRMKLDELAALVAAGEMPGQLLRDVRLAGTGRSLEDDLLLLL